MTQEHDYDPELAARLDDRLREYTLSRPLSPRSATRRRSPVAAAAIAVLAAAGLVGIGFGVNAAADSQGGGCLDPVAKVHLVVTSMTDAHTDGHAVGTGDRQHTDGCHSGDQHQR